MNVFALVFSRKNISDLSIRSLAWTTLVLLNINTVFFGKKLKRLLNSEIDSVPKLLSTISNLALSLIGLGV